MSALSLLRLLLRTEIHIFNAAANSFRSGYLVDDEVVASARLILLHQGSIRYVVGQLRFAIEAPALIFVPPWVRRHWQVPRRKTTELIWCEFSPNFFEPTLHQILIKKHGDWRLESASLRRMVKQWRGDRLAPQKTDVALRLEGELKACLGRFFASEKDLLQGGSSSRRVSAHWISEIAQAQLWLEQNLASDHAISDLESQSSHCAATFRRFFRLQTGLTPTGYLHALRMRFARYLLCESKRLVKEVAGAVGYRDPLYFSKQYRAFWGHAPKLERNGKVRS